LTISSMLFFEQIALALPRGGGLSAKESA